MVNEFDGNLEVDQNELDHCLAEADDMSQLKLILTGKLKISLMHMMEKILQNSMKIIKLGKIYIPITFYFICHSYGRSNILCFIGLILLPGLKMSQNLLFFSVV